MQNFFRGCALKGPSFSSRGTDFSKTDSEVEGGNLKSGRQRHDEKCTPAARENFWSFILENFSGFSTEKGLNLYVSHIQSEKRKRVQFGQDKGRSSCRKRGRQAEFSS